MADCKFRASVHGIALIVTKGRAIVIRRKTCHQFRPAIDVLFTRHHELRVVKREFAATAALRDDPLETASALPAWCALSSFLACFFKCSRLDSPGFLHCVPTGETALTRHRFQRVDHTARSENRRGGNLGKARRGLADAFTSRCGP